MGQYMGGLSCSVRRGTMITEWSLEEAVLIPQCTDTMYNDDV